MRCFETRAYRSDFATVVWKILPHYGLYDGRRVPLTKTANLWFVAAIGLDHDL